MMKNNMIAAAADSSGLCNEPLASFLSLMDAIKGDSGVEGSFLVQPPMGNVPSFNPACARRVALSAVCVLTKMVGGICIVTVPIVHILRGCPKRPSGGQGKAQGLQVEEYVENNWITRRKTYGKNMDYAGKNTWKNAGITTRANIWKNWVNTMISPWMPVCKNRVLRQRGWCIKTYGNNSWR